MKKQCNLPVHLVIRNMAEKQLVTAKFFDIIRSRILTHLETSAGTFCSDSYGVETRFSEFFKNVKYFVRKFPKNHKKIAILAEKNHMNYAAIVAVVLSGRTWIPISLEMPMDRIVNVLETSKPDLLLTTSSFDFYRNSKIEDLTKQIMILEDFFNFEADDSFIWPDISEKETAIIFHTSGSTGRPKGVEISFSNLAAALTNTSPIFGRPNMLWGDYHDLSFVISINILFTCLISKGRIFCANNNIDQISPTTSLVEKKINCLVTVPSALSRINKDKNFQKIFSNLKVLASCGEPLPLKLLEVFVGKPKLEVFNFYGSTEVTTWVFHHKCTQRDLRTFSKYGYAPLGEVIKDNKYLISDEGILLIAGKQICSCYTGKQRKSHLEKINGEDWFSTGDIVEIMEEKVICKGRIDSQIKLNGYRIHLMDIETKAMSLDIVDGCICFLETVSKKLVISCTIVTKSKVTKEILMKHFRSLLPNYMVPKRYYVVSSKPTNKNGKLDRLALKAIANDSTLLN